MEERNDVLAILCTKLQKEEAIMACIKVYGKPLKMEVDTGAARSIRGEK